MKRNQKQEKEDDTELLKAVAQAWHAHSASAKAAADSAEFDAHRLYFKGRPSRFKLEAMRKPFKRGDDNSQKSWDFGQSLWDSYEILSVSKKLETGLVADDPFSDEQLRRSRRRESKNSLRNLYKMSS
ncbi:hypothetical protein SASPL_151703 [Salvia splendens]|uniref:Uncharacterized protein n=1 Tax=Salvia splendens TaxID=180675 RepID=A0A8X8Z0M7_SALSN|nr:uncharacterized protein LOC121785238 [Salvia splendens]KAG6386537.1 hypothetical protein SASPL_151703 [Salvia splendens]